VDDRCSRHADDPDPPACGACADARRRWEADRLHDDQQRRTAEAVQRAQLRRAEVDRCRLCDDRGYLPSGNVCHHRVPASNGAAAARAALAAVAEAA
jgi:hypothetical protein